MDMMVYVITNNDKIPKFKLPDCYQVLNAGGISKRGFLSDKEGCSISEKNSSYCELTGFYYIWKNLESKADIIGICHYRRCLTLNQFYKHIPKFISSKFGAITKEDIMPLLNSSGAIVSLFDTGKLSVYEQYCVCHKRKDIDLIRKIIEELYPEYLDTYDEVLNGHTLCLGNMIITHNVIFCRYCSWLFCILSEFEKQCDIADYDNYQKRVYGFLAERLMYVWLKKNKIRLHSLPYIFFK